MIPKCAGLEVGLYLESGEVGGLPSPLCKLGAVVIDGLVSDLGEDSNLRNNSTLE